MVFLAAKYCTLVPRHPDSRARPHPTLGHQVTTRPANAVESHHTVITHPANATEAWSPSPSHTPLLRAAADNKIQAVGATELARSLHVNKHLTSLALFSEFLALLG
jgi:hypothetical protein